MTEAQIRRATIDDAEVIATSSRTRSFTPPIQDPRHKQKHGQYNPTGKKR
jgi:hypothetical protein